MFFARARRGGRTAGFAALFFLSSLMNAAPGRAQAGDPLPSWNEGMVKRRIIAFVTAAINPGQGFIKEQDRIAVFDNDGTLTQETPAIEGEFAAEQVRRMTTVDPIFRKKVQTYLAALPGKKARPALLEDLTNIGLAAHGGVSEEDFADMARVWLSHARHPKFDRPYPELRYQPMMELLAYLRANKFETWLCTGGTADFIRVYAPTAYGIPPQQIIGSLLKLETASKSGRAYLKRVPGVVRISDREGKPIGIAQQIGRRPVLCCGNVKSGGDIAMLRYTQGNAAPNLSLLVNHDDASREFAYGEPDNASLKAANVYGFTVISMKRDWAKIFPAKTGEAASNGANGAKTDAAPVKAPATEAKGAPTLEGVEWKLTEVDGKPIEETVAGKGNKTVGLKFDAAAKRVAGFGGVNTFSARYQREGDALKCAPILSTKMAGPPEAMALEAAFLNALESATTYRIAGDALELRKDDVIVARFIKQ